MAFTTTLRRMMIDLSGYWMHQKKFLPVGADLIVDLKNKIHFTPKTIFDVGANIGQTASSLAKAFPKARIVSFEPVRDTFTQLKHGVRHYKNVFCHQVALSDKKEEVEIKLFDAESSFLNSLNDRSMNLSATARVERIQTETVDGFLEANPENAAIDLLKIDTEGYEMPVLRGARKSLEKGMIRLIYLEVGFSAKDNRHSYFPTVLEFLEACSYTFFGLYEVHHYEIEKQHHYANALFIHNSQLKQLKNIAKY